MRLFNTFFAYTQHEVSKRDNSSRFHFMLTPFIQRACTALANRTFVSIFRFKCVMVFSFCKDRQNRLNCKTTQWLIVLNSYTTITAFGSWRLSNSRSNLTRVPTFRPYHTSSASWYILPAKWQSIKYSFFVSIILIIKLDNGKYKVRGVPKVETPLCELG